MKNSSTLVVALDFPRAEPALDLANQLRPVLKWVKVGLELYLAAGRKFILELKDMGYQVFLDLKFMDIPNTVQSAVAQSTALGIDMLTIHLLGGQKMCAAALAGRHQGLGPAQKPPLIYGVTLLTSLSPQDLIWKPQATTEDMQALATALAQGGQHWGLDGVVCSGAEISAIRQACGPTMGILTPGIRLPDAETGDQQRVCTPGQAVQAGSNFLVVGRPITRAADPLAMAHNYLQAMAQD